MAMNQLLILCLTAKVVRHQSLKLSKAEQNKKYCKFLDFLICATAGCCAQSEVQLMFADGLTVKL